MNINDKLNWDFTTTQKVLSQISTVEKFQGKWEVLERSETSFLKELRHIATIQSIGSSTRIEGSRLSDEDVRKLLKNIQINDLKTRDDQEVIGYWETLELILENAADIPLSERFIFQLHALLLKYSDKDDRSRGAYKNLPNRVVATYPDGSEKTIFDTTAPHLVQKEMSELIEWTNYSLTNQTIHPLIIIATFVYEFLSIHPFHDGNGRMSRLLTTLLLVKQNYYFVQYVSFEHAIEDHKKEYYQKLMECQSKRGTERELIGSWVVFFLDRMKALSIRLEEKLSRVSYNGEYLTDRQKQIVELLKSGVAMKLGDVSRALPEFSIHTLKKDLQKLLELQIIQKMGNGKGTSYRFDILKDD